MMDQLLGSLTLQVFLAFLSVLIFLLLNNTVLILMLALTIPLTALTLDLFGSYITLSEFLALLILMKILLRFFFKRFNSSYRFKLKVESPKWLIPTVLFFLFSNTIILVLFFQPKSLIDVLQKFIYVLGGIFIGRELFSLRLYDRFLSIFLIGIFGISILYTFNLNYFSLNFLQKNVAGLLFAFSYCISFFYLKKVWISAGLSLWFFYATLISQSRSALLGLGFVIVYSFFFWKKTWLNSLLLVVGIPTLIWLTISDRQTRDYLIFWDRDPYGRFDSPTEIRFNFTRMAISAWQESPWFGAGFNSGFISALSTHNLFTQALIDGGIILLSATVILFTLVTVYLFKIPKSDVKFIVVSIWIVSLSHALFDSYWSRNRILFVWILVGFISQYAAGMSIPRYGSLSTRFNRRINRSKHT